nr:putative ribonuclease H-like domain-containing protein [Tanacetum cinerariifolium]
MADAKEMWEAIKSIFYGNDESKKMQKYLLKRQFEGFSVSASEGLHKGYDRFQTLLSQLEIHDAGVSYEDANQKFLRFLPSFWSQRDVKGTTASSSSNIQNVAFVSADNTSSTNDVAMISMRIKKFHKRTGRKLQFDTKDPVGFDKTKVECFNCHKIRHFARDCRAKGNQDSRRRDGGYNGNKARDNSRRPAYHDDSKALVTIDEEDIDWSGHVEEDTQNYAMMAYSSSNSRSKNKDDPHKALKDKGIIDSGCSRHMTGNKAHLTDYQDFKGGSVAFGGSNERIIVLLKIPRQHNMYSFNFKNIDPSGDLACLFTKASIDESNKWHRRLGHTNFQNLNKLVKGNLVRGLSSKIFENDHTCVACQKRKQHKASCKAKTVSFVNQPLQILHMDLFGPTSVRSMDHKTYYLVITDGFSRFSWVYFLKSKDETTPILKDFIRQAKSQFNHKVKTIRSDNGTEFKNHELIEFCGLKRIRREYSNARTLQQNEVAERKNRTPLLRLLKPCPKEVNHSAGTQANDDQGANSEEIDLHDEHFVLPIWSAYSTTIKSLGTKTKKTTDCKTCEKPVSQVEQIFQEELEKLKIQEKEAHDVVRKEATPLNDGEPLCPDDPLMPHLEDIYASPSEGIFTDSSYDDEGVVTDFNNLETAMNVSLTPTTRIHTIHPKTQIVGDPLSAVQTRSKVNKNSEARALSAFMYGTIDEEVYVTQPLGFVDPKFPNKVYKVVKALYGLHQAPRAWYATLSTFLEQSGYRRGAIDKTLFIKQDKKDIMLVQVYVDDIIFGSTKKSCVKTASTPIETQKPLVKDEEAVDVDVYLYRFQVTPKTSHLQAVKRIFRYLKGQPKLGLWYPKVSSFDLEAYSDSDYACVNLDKKFTTGATLVKGRLLEVTTAKYRRKLQEVKLDLKSSCWDRGSLCVGFHTTPQMVINSPCLTHIKNWLVQE